jgi:hypothetical protein
LVLETTDPDEFVGLFAALRANPGLERAIRRAGCVTAKQYIWPKIIQRILLPRIRLFAPRASFPTDKQAGEVQAYTPGGRRRHSSAREVLKWTTQGADTRILSPDKADPTPGTMAQSKPRGWRSNEVRRKLLVG